MTTPLQNRVVLVTGATGALGSATAQACARAGATVVLLSRGIPRLEKLYDAIVAAGGPQPALYPLDLAGATEKDYADLADTLERELGALHGLVHCAAELGSLGPLADVTGERWQRLLHVNLTAPAIMTRELLPLLKAGAGAAVFVGDSAVGLGKAYWGGYGVAKIGLEGYARILADETEGHGLKVHYFIPGPLQSPIRRSAYPAEPPEALAKPDTAAGRILALLAPNP
ncbi:SDR family NAD(P)-dependent oxidoreductase [Methylomagnum ishizawai]|uniref:SDR family NAD(P)-dependent oxidoreductase n=1 Tax=Methylomagnum ishizawai TaxID=1760988 RepID=UPI001C32FF31|nr:SDR family NAD(P)-dependent oxidoreductase [Methylomagnum ishizawai]BBL75643.1 short-chain dehydrogenase [Methylomagnum ishizawai]